MKEITAFDLKAMMEKGEDFQLIDVREAYEYEDANLGGLLIPLDELETRAEEISRDKKVILQCAGGVRSAHAIQFLEKEYGFDNLYNLRGGIAAFINDIGLNG